MDNLNDICKDAVTILQDVQIFSGLLFHLLELSGMGSNKYFLYIDFLFHSYNMEYFWLVIFDHLKCSCLVCFSLFIIVNTI